MSVAAGNLDAINVDGQLRSGRVYGPDPDLGRHRLVFRQGRRVELSLASGARKGAARFAGALGAGGDQHPAKARTVQAMR
ncbi:hypothetical protein QFZ76_009717 [Streptomyces sp. V4I2]|nr:hypothetical protein [Streptomyces sp. V4I2]